MPAPAPAWRRRGGAGLVCQEGAREKVPCSNWWAVAHKRRVAAAKRVPHERREEARPLQARGNDVSQRAAAAGRRERRSRKLRGLLRAPGSGVAARRRSGASRPPGGRRHQEPAGGEPVLPPAGLPPPLPRSLVRSLRPPPSRAIVDRRRILPPFRRGRRIRVARPDHPPGLSSERLFPCSRWRPRAARRIVCRTFVASAHPSTQRAFDALAQIMMMISPQ